MNRRYIFYFYVVACVIFSSSPLHAVMYTAKILSTPVANSNSQALGATVGSQVGIYDASPGTHASLWNSSANSVVDLNPVGFTYTRAYSASGNIQVGEGQEGGELSPHAILWNGTAESAVNLRPIGYLRSAAYGAWGETQVGFAVPSGGQSYHHAIVWNGSAQSAVDLNPPGHFESEAHSAWNATQVGWANRGIGQHAMLWHGTAASYTDLHPAGWSFSYASGVAGNVQVGMVLNSNSNLEHAALWNGSASTFVDLHPAGYSTSKALATNGELHVGVGRDTSAGGFFRALLWSGTDANVINLHDSLASTGRSFEHSFATGIAADGTIVGYAGGNSASSQYAILWTPVPEPTFCTLLLCAAFAAISLRLPRRC